jgi:hypothetical protein
VLRLGKQEIGTMTMMTVQGMWSTLVGARLGPRADTHVRPDNAPVGPGISPQIPSSMPRAEDDADTWAQSPEFHDRPGSGKHTADKLTFF